MSRGAPEHSIATRGRVKAATVRVRDNFVLARYGRTSRQAYHAAASKELLETLTAGGDRWVPFAHFVEATELVCKLFADGDVTLAREIGRFGAETNMGVWRSLVYRVLSPKTILNIAGGLWSHHYEGGRLVTEAAGPHGVVVRIVDFPQPSRAHCLSIEGWILRTIELGRPKHVTVTESQCRLRGGSFCELRADWD